MLTTIIPPSHTVHSLETVGIFDKCETPIPTASRYIQILVDIHLQQRVILKYIIHSRVTLNYIQYTYPTTI